MSSRLPRMICWLGVCVMLLAATAHLAYAAPTIDKLSLRGLQAGGVTTLVIEGRELLPEPRIWFAAPGAKHTIVPGATDKRLEVTFALDGKTPPGIYLLRVASASGISTPVAVGVDHLAQIPFAPELVATDVAMSGELRGDSVLKTLFSGKKGQRVVCEVESRRLGAKLNPIVRLYDPRNVPTAWAQGQSSLAGDARLVTTLPADGTYSIEVHDALYRGADPGYFRLKVGDLQFADVAFPLAVQQDKEAAFEFPRGSLAESARASVKWSIPDGRQRIIRPAPWPADVLPLTGAQPQIIVSSHAELVEEDAGGEPQQLAAAPVAINGRLAKAGEQDRYRLTVSPGAKLRFDVLANRAGSPVDGVLSIQNASGAELAASDDRRETRDPGLDYTVPKDTDTLIVALRDLQGRGGPDFVYRIGITPLGQPDFSLSLESDRLLIPKDGAALARVRVQRSGYNGPIKLAFLNLPEGVGIDGAEIPARASQALVTLTAPGLHPRQSLATILGTSVQADPPITRMAAPPVSGAVEHLPWFEDEVAVAVTNPSPLALAWEPFGSETRLSVGTALPIKLSVARAEGTSGSVRLQLLTSQVMPRKKVKVNNQEQEVDDVERSIRLADTPTIAADQNEIEAQVLVPSDLPRLAYDVAIRAELLGADGKQVIQSAVTPARRLLAAAPMSIQLAATDPIEARAGLGDTGKVAGKVVRAAGFDKPVILRVSGLPKGSKPVTFEVPADQSEFEFPLAVRYGAPEGKLDNVRLVATSQLDPKNAKSVVRSQPVPLLLNVVPGEKPPPEQPRAVFEDHVEFLAALTEGGGKASIVADEKYSGLASIKVTPDQRFNPTIPNLSVKIREFPAPGEYRFIRFAWKKHGGEAICLQLSHDGKFGPEGDGKASFRYHAGPAGQCYGASVAVDEALPGEFTVVTRDLFADFGEFTLTGMALSPVDGEHALFDHIYLGTTAEDFTLVKP